VQATPYAPVRPCAFGESGESAEAEGDDAGDGEGCDGEAGQLWHGGFFQREAEGEEAVVDVHGRADEVESFEGR